LKIRERLARRWGAELIANTAAAAAKAARDLALEEVARQLEGWPVKGTVIVNRKTGTGDLRGVLWEVSERHLILRRAELVGAGDAKPIDGDALIERDEVEFLQIIKR
jgi:hypothetical protein